MSVIAERMTRITILSEAITEITHLRSALDNACAFVAHDRPPITKAEWLDYFILVAKEQMKLAEEE